IKIGVAGLSDIVGLYKGRFVAIEVKLPKRRKYVTSIQQQFLDNIKENGGIAGVATDVDEAIKIVKDQWKAGV
ncbi:MAG: hypothetical protein U1D67_00670, partial [Dehalococcoidia bacterium]|nr:hypothetical protein [Dehalococcoidia bacterium]